MVIALVIYGLFVACGVAHEVLRRRVSLTAACFTSVAFVHLVLVAHVLFPAIPWAPVLLSLCVAGLLSAAVAGRGMLREQRSMYHGVQEDIEGRYGDLMASLLIGVTAFGSQSEDTYVASDSVWISAALTVIGILIAAVGVAWFILAAWRDKQAKEHS